MSPEQRDWDKELAEIDKVIARSPQAGLPPAPASAPVPAAQGQSLPAAAPVRSRKATAATWFQVILGGLLAIGMTQWPYAHGCGIKLFLYMGAAALVVVAGVWGAVSSWRRHMGLAHTLALVVTLWGLVLVAREVLPRIGYAAEASTWMCP
jgi:hypothetical protein